MRQVNVKLLEIVPKLQILLNKGGKTFSYNSKRRRLSVIVRENRAEAKDQGRPFTFIFSQYKSYLKRLGMVAFAEVDVRFSSRNHHSIILGPPAAKNNRDFGQLCVTVKHTSYDS